jgi:nucleoside-diphosphate-sugar epimerase
MADILRQHFPGIDLVHHPRDRLMPERGTLCVDKARKLLGYDPQFPLERGYVSYINWYKELVARQPELFDLPGRGPARASA